MLIRTKEGDLTLDAAGVSFRPFTLHGDPTPTTWPWSAVRRVALEDGSKKVDREHLAMGGLLGLLFRRSRTLLVMSAEDRDVVFETKQPRHELRAAARRLQDDVPATAGKVLL